jgi:hypothetical protein
MELLSDLSDWNKEFHVNKVGSLSNESEKHWFFTSILEWVL